jgi:hypothetical protein
MMEGAFYGCLSVQKECNVYKENEEVDVKKELEISN